MLQPRPTRLRGISPPESSAAARGELRHIHVKGANGTIAWHQSFGPDTPTQAVAGFLAALISSPSRHCPCI
ncbi:DUF317 domain-containing protein [Streptomyces sp. NPDC101227]|uniref:DUF317 domain-containing protein n=1 Tax=Streptomyces sp. NPDC101227 TaxID=3366136 RepID=UPI0037F1B822